MTDDAHELCKRQIRSSNAPALQSVSTPNAHVQVAQPEKVARHPTIVSLTSDLLDSPHKGYIDLARACEGVREEVYEVEARQWAERNAVLVSAYTEMVEREELPLERYRTL